MQGRLRYRGRQSVKNKGKSETRAPSSGTRRREQTQRQGVTGSYGTVYMENSAVGGGITRVQQGTCLQGNENKENKSDKER